MILLIRPLTLLFILLSRMRPLNGGLPRLTRSCAGDDNPSKRLRQISLPAELRACLDEFGRVCHEPTELENVSGHSLGAYFF